MNVKSIVTPRLRGAGPKASPSPSIKRRKTLLQEADRKLVRRPSADNLTSQRLLRPGSSQARFSIGRPEEMREQHAASIEAQFRAVTKPGAETSAKRQTLAVDTPGMAPRKHGAKGVSSSKRTPSTLPDGLPREKEMTLNAATQQFADELFGVDFGHVRLHTGPAAEMTAAHLGARAFTQGSHIWLGLGAHESDRPLMAHELTHVLQPHDRIYLRRATRFERRAWLSFFDHYLPRKFLNNYMNDTGNPITLTLQEMKDVNPRVDLTKSPDFRTKLGALQASVLAQSRTNNKSLSSSRYIEVRGPGQAMTNGTLGNFTIIYKGTLTANSDGSWAFRGIMSFYDIWDFDRKPFGRSGRSTLGEIKTRVAAYALPGRQFSIFSVAAPIMQTSSDPRAVWAGGTPTFVVDRAGRAGADIAVGDVGGGDVDTAVGGPDIGDVGAGAGGEFGAQSAADNP